MSETGTHGQGRETIDDNLPASLPMGPLRTSRPMRSAGKAALAPRLTSSAADRSDRDADRICRFVRAPRIA